MSQILFQGNNLVVTGNLGNIYSNVPLGDGVEAPENSHRRTLFLDFIIQMNGKMIVHKEAISLYIDIESTENPSPEDWNGWYSLCRIFDSLGYSISEDRTNEFSASSIMRRWVENLLKSNIVD